MKRIPKMTAGLAALMLVVPMTARAALSVGDVNGSGTADSGDAAELLAALARIGAGQTAV